MSDNKYNKLMKTYAKIFTRNGFTVDKDLNDVEGINYIVSTPIKESIIKLETFTFEQFIKLSQEYLTTDGFFGCWVEEGFIYFDISQGFGNFQNALATAIKNNQISIWDNYNKKVIYVCDSIEEIKV